MHVAYKINKSALKSSCCRRPGEGSFFVAKRTWYRLLKDFPVRTEDERRWLPCAFEKDAAKVFDDVTGRNYNGTADQL